MTKRKMSKEISKNGFFVLALLLFCIGIIGQSGLAKAEKAKEASTRKFIVGFDAEFPPYGYKDKNGEYVGFDLDLAQEVCKRRGWKLVKQPIDWDSKDMELKTGSISCIWNGFTMNGRENNYTWSTPYVDNSQVVIVRKEDPINKLTDLGGKNVVVQADSSALAALTGDDATASNKKLAKSFANLQQVGDYNSAFLNLDSGSVDAICMDIGVASYQIKSRGDKYKMLSEKISSEEYGIGFKKGNTKLRNEVEESLLSMLDDGTFQKIAKKWNLETSVCLSHKDHYIDQTKKADKKTQTASPNKAGTGKLAQIIDITEQLLTGMRSTLLIFFLTLLFSLPLGLVLMFIRMSSFKLFQWIAKIYISIMRGTPLMLQLLVVFFGPHFLLGTRTTYGYRFYAVIIGFSLNYAAYFAEIYRSGIQSIPKGQREAASVMGYNRVQTFCKIILPQMIKRVMPPVTNEVITLVKDTSLAFALTYTEMFTLAKQIAASRATMMPLFVAGLFYYIFNFLVAFGMEYVEKKLSYYE